MSSMEPLPPAVPPAQKPTRIIKPWPPGRPRPSLLPWPAPGAPSQESPATPAPSPDPAQPLSPPLPGNVRRIVGRFNPRAPSPPSENGAQRPPPAPPGMEPRDGSSAPRLWPGRAPGAGPPEPSSACPPRCPCGCHQHRPDMVLVWVPAPQGAELASDGSASSNNEDGPPFRRHLLARPDPQARRPPCQLPEGGAVLTGYPSPTQLIGARAKPPRRAKGRGLEGEGPPPPAVPPKVSVKPPQASPIPGKPCRPPPLPPGQPPLPPSPLPSQDPPPPPPPSQPPPQKESTPERGAGPCQGDCDRQSPEPEPSTDRCCPSRKGPGWGLPLQDEPLYQEYRQAVICKEIRRQTLPPGASGDGDPAPPATPGAPAPRSTLWQELPAVRESGLLGRITPQECKMQESLFEVLTSEASYQRSLRLLATHFVGSRELGETLAPHERQALFSSILRVKEVSAREKNGRFAAVLARLEADPACQRLPLLSFLLLPLQRITRIKMLLENILRRAEEGSERERNALDALACVSKLVEQCNAEVERMRRTEELVQVAGRIDFNRLKAVPLISQGRRLEKQGELAEVLPRGSLFGTRPRTAPLSLFLFSDLLLLAQRKSAERFVVLDYGHRSLVSVQGVGDPPPVPGLARAFYLTRLENHQGRASERLCQAPSQSEMHRWMEAFLQPNAPPSQPQETIYEDWDCPQVQCVEPYVARQADELSLEPADLVKVLRKTSEGWCQGLRLADGRRGWFPAAHVREITSEHLRRRNLHQRHRLLQAARQLQLGRRAGNGDA
ncbi:rho guanine nucleotide exchange factor 15-like isoform X1 [Emydura macquarii macquarii]|uniref:rho guanine nucleotide exchange factor 15-like isoform X1 n=1 Tax=Emydura macquarii macquarii TaxID=1129001 RepID=UPI00352B781B